MKLFTRSYSHVNSILAVKISILLLLLAVVSLASGLGNNHDEVSLQYRNQDSHGLNLRKKRSTCLQQGLSCDHRPYDCCDSIVCRCNLWGTNCRCRG